MASTQINTKYDYKSKHHVMNISAVRNISPCDVKYCKEINKHVIICLHNKLGLLTEPGDPHLSKHVLVGEVLVGVQEPTLYYVEMMVHI